MKNWLDKYADGGTMQEYQENYNDSQTSLPPGFVGMGNDISGRNYSPAWGGQFAMGGSIPGSVGFTYARTINPAPSEGPYAKKTMPSAQNGEEMKYWQEGLDWKPKTISKNGGWLEKFQPGGMLFVPSEQQLPVAAGTLEAMGEGISAPQKAATYLASGKYQTPSEAMGIENPYGAFAADFLLDPVNLIGGKWLGKGAEAASNMAKTIKNSEGVGKLNQLIKHSSVKAKDHLAGVIASLDDPRPFFEKFPITKAQRDAAVTAQNKAYAEGIDFTKDYFYGNDINLRPEIEQRIRNIDPFISDDNNFLKTAENNPISKARNILLSTRTKDLEKTGLPLSTKEEILNNRGSARGYNNPETNESITFRNHGFYSLPPERAKHTGIHELTHSAQRLGERNGLPYSAELTNYDPNVTDYFHANPYTDLGREFAEGMASPVKNKYVWNASPDELHSEILPSKEKIYRKAMAKGLSHEDAMDMIVNPSDKTIDRLIKMVDHRKFFKPSTTQEEKRRLVKLLPAVVPAVGVAASQQKDGGITKDDAGYWNPDNWGKPVEIGSNNITMQGVNQPLLGISDTGDTQYMVPGKDYKFKGKKVREYPIGKNGLRQEQKSLQNLDNLTNFTNYNTPQKGGWLQKYSK